MRRFLREERDAKNEWEFVSRPPPGPLGTKYRPVQLTEWLALLAYCMPRSDPGLIAPLSGEFNLKFES